MNRDKEADLKLLAEAFFENLYCDGENCCIFGLDPNRPFGNSNIISDVFDIISMEETGYNEHTDDYYSPEQYQYVRDLYFKDLIIYLKNIKV